MLSLFTYTEIHTYTHTYMHGRTHRYTHTHKDRSIKTHTDTHSHKDRGTDTRTHTDTHTHTHTGIMSFLMSCHTQTEVLMTGAFGVTGAVIGLLDSLWHRSAGPQCTGQKRRAGAQGRRCNTRELPVCLCVCLCVCVCVLCVCRVCAVCVVRV